MIAYIGCCFVLIFVGLTVFAFCMAPDERAEVRAMLAVRRARKGKTK